jgi:hypothetical protein
MEKTGLHPGLEARLTALATRIAELKRRMNQMKGVEKIEAFGEVKELEQRYQVREDRLHALNRRGPGLRQNIEAELEKVTDDLSGVVEDFIMWVDSGYDRNRRPKRPQKS